jgi:hypothetical protein
MLFGWGLFILHFSSTLVELVDEVLNVVLDYLFELRFLVLLMLGDVLHNTESFLRRYSAREDEKG